MAKPARDFKTSRRWGLLISTDLMMFFNVCLNLSTCVLSRFASIELWPPWHGTEPTFSRLAVQHPYHSRSYTGTPSNPYYLQCYWQWYIALANCLI